jgi:hypothetical protein
VPVGLDLLTKPDGKTEEHGFLVVTAFSVPLLYGAPVDTAIGTTVAVLTMTSSAAEDGAAPFPLPAVTAATLPAAPVGVAVYVN